MWKRHPIPNISQYAIFLWIYQPIALSWRGPTISGVTNVIKVWFPGDIFFQTRNVVMAWFDGFVRCVAYCAKLALPTAQLSNCPNFLTWTVCPLHYHILKKRFLGTLKLQKWHCKKDHSWTLTADHPRFVQTLSSLIFYLAGDLFDMLLPMLSIYQVCIQSKRWIVRISKRGITFHFSSGVCSESSLQSPGSWLYLLQKFTSS